MGSRSSLAAIMSMQRSGTHMLGAGINSHPQMEYVGELFCRRVPDSPERMWELIDRVRCGGVRAVCLDVKYNQISAPVEQLLKQIPVIHLIRRDLDRHYYSGELHDLYSQDSDAKRLGVTPRFEVVPERFDEIAAKKEQYLARFGALETIRLYYEDLTGNQEIDRLPDAPGRLICETLGVPYRELRVVTTKNAPSNSHELLERML